MTIDVWWFKFAALFSKKVDVKGKIFLTSLLIPPGLDGLSNFTIDSLDLTTSTMKEIKMIVYATVNNPSSFSISPLGLCPRRSSNRD